MKTLEELFNSRPQEDDYYGEDAREDFISNLENYCDDLENETEEMLDTLIEIIKENMQDKKLMYHDEEIKNLVEYVYKKKHNFHREYKEAMIVLEKQNKELKKELCAKCGKCTLKPGTYVEDSNGVYVQADDCYNCKWHNKDWYCLGNKNYYKINEEENINEQ